MELLRPIKIDKNKMEVVISSTSSFDFTDPILDTTISKSVKVLTVGKMGCNINFDTTQPSAERLSFYSSIQHLIKNCVENGESIKARLTAMRLQLVPVKNFEERESVLKMDFMALRTWFVDYILKTKAHQQFIKYNSTKKFKEFSKPFYEFVIDRNIYTHGILCFVMPNYDLAIEFIDSAPTSERSLYKY